MCIVAIDITLIFHAVVTSKYKEAWMTLSLPVSGSRVWRKGCFYFCDICLYFYCDIYLRFWDVQIFLVRENSARFALGGLRH